MRPKQQRRNLPIAQFPIIAHDVPQLLNNCKPVAIVRCGALQYFIMGSDENNTIIVFTNDVRYKTILTTKLNKLYELQRWEVKKVVELLQSWKNSVTIIKDTTKCKPLKNHYGAVRVFENNTITIEECKNLIVSKLQSDFI